MDNKFLIWLIFCLLIVSCKKEESENYNPKFVVEGSIEQDGYANVSITHNLPFYTTINAAQLNEIIIKYAKVTVTDGINSEVLTGTLDEDRFPYFFYRGSFLKGEIGKTYNLLIEYAGYTLTAETTIPKPPQLDQLWFQPKENDQMQLNISFTDNIEEKNYYKIYTKLDADKIFTRTLLSNQDDKYFNGKTVSLQINRGSINNTTKKFEPYFIKGDKVLVKFASIPQSGYDFWEGFQNEILNSSNPLMGSTTPLKSNIVGNGIGIWCGYGSSYYTTIAK